MNTVASSSLSPEERASWLAESEDAARAGQFRVAEQVADAYQRSLSVAQRIAAFESFWLSVVGTELARPDMTPWRADGCFLI